LSRDFAKKPIKKPIKNEIFLFFVAIVGFKDIFSRFIKQIYSHFLQLDRGVKQPSDGFAVIIPCSSSVISISTIDDTGATRVVDAKQ
jgi:hypothetical protein